MDRLDGWSLDMGSERKREAKGEERARNDLVMSVLVIGKHLLLDGDMNLMVEEAILTNGGRRWNTCCKEGITGNKRYLPHRRFRGRGCPPHTTHTFLTGLFIC